MFEEGNEDRSGDFRLHPSAISGCERNAIYGARGEPVSNERPARNTRIMGNGTMYHERLQAYLKERFPGALMEVPVEWGPIKGHADILMPVADGSDGPGLLSPVYELADFKTISPNGKRWLQPSRGNGKKHPPRAGGPKPEHVKQVRLYYMGLRRMGKLLTDNIRIVYIDRDDWSTLEFDDIEPWTGAEEDEQLERMAELEAHLWDGTLPEQMPDTYWLCKMCEFRTTCKGLE